MDPSYVIETWGKIILVSLFFVGLLGVVLHAYFSSRLAFFNFGNFGTSDTSNKEEAKRIVVPWIIVAVLCAIIPVVIVYSSQELLGYLKNPSIADYVRPPWNYIMPVIAIEVSMMTCALIGSLFYFAGGFTSWLIWKRRYKRP